VLKQIYYSTKERLSIRLIALLVMLGINLLFLVLTIGASPGSGVMITAVVFSSLAMSYLIIANMFVSFASVHEIFSAPKGYHTLLVPVPGWKIILGRVIPAAVMDTLMMAIGIFLVVWHSLRLSGMWPLAGQPDFFAQDILLDVSFGVVAALVGYALLLIIFCFFRVISKGLLYNAPLRIFLSILLTFVAIWVISSASNLLLLPFGRVEIWGLLVNIVIYPSPLARVMYVLVLLLQAAVFFLVSARLMERRLNV